MKTTNIGLGNKDYHGRVTKLEKTDIIGDFAGSLGLVINNLYAPIRRYM